MNWIKILASKDLTMCLVKLGMTRGRVAGGYLPSSGPLNPAPDRPPRRSRARVPEQDRARRRCSALGGHDRSPGEGAGRGSGRVSGHGRKGLERPARDHSQEAEALRAAHPGAEGGARRSRVPGRSGGAGRRLVSHWTEEQSPPMITLEKDRMTFRFPEVHPEAECSIEFQRTLLIPDDDRSYPLPPGLGRLPLRHVDEFANRLPGKTPAPGWRGNAHASG